MLEFEIEAATWEAIVRAAGIGEISAERIREELVRIFLSPQRARGWDLLDASGLMKQVLPELEAMKGCAQPPQFHPEGDVFRHTRLMLELLPNEVSLPLVLSVLFHDIGKPPTSSVDETGRIRFNGHDRVGAEMTEALMQRLRFSRAEIDATVEAVRQHMVFKDVPNMRVAKLKRFMARPTFADELELHRVDCASSHGMLDNYEFLQRKQEEFANEPIIPPPLVRGDDLIALGMKPGPRFGEILEAVETQQLEGNAARSRRGPGLDQKEIPVRRGLSPSVFWPATSFRAPPLLVIPSPRRRRGTSPKLFMSRKRGGAIKTMGGPQRAPPASG